MVVFDITESKSRMIGMDEMYFGICANDVWGNQITASFNNVPCGSNKRSVSPGMCLILQKAFE